MRPWSRPSTAIAAKASKRSQSSTFTSTRGGRPLSALSRRRVEFRAEMKGNLMHKHKPLPMHLSRRCGAKTRSGSPCRSPAMPNGRCRMHGGASQGAPKGKRNGNYRHGRFTNDAIAGRRKLGAWLRVMKKIVEEVE